MAAVDDIMKTAHSLARLDVASSLGLLAAERVSSSSLWILYASIPLLFPLTISLLPLSSPLSSLSLSLSLSIPPPSPPLPSTNHHRDTASLP